MADTIEQLDTISDTDSEEMSEQERQLNEELYTACKDGDVVEVETCLSRGGDINYHSEARFNGTPLHTSASNGHEDVIKLLLEQPAVNVDSRDEDGDTPLHDSAWYGHPAVAKLLLDAGASLSSVNNFGNSPLHLAAYNGHLDTVELFALRGADLSLCDEDGQTALDRARVGKTFKSRGDERDKVVEYLESVESQSASTTATPTTSTSPQQPTDTQRHIATYNRMMKEKGSLNLHTLHLILHGLPAAGKTCAKLRLTGQKLTSRKPAERRDGTLVYPLDDGARSTPVAEEIIRARLPASATALTSEADNEPWYLLQSLDEEIVGLVEKFAKQSPEAEKEKKNTSTAVSSSSRKISLPAEPVVGKASENMIISAFNNAPHNTLQDILKETLIYLIDSGGQPQFQELLPLLVSGPSVFLLTFSLAVPLDEFYQVQFTDEDGKREVYSTNMRVRDVLTQSLASIRCTCCYQTKGKERVEVKPRVIFMATMSNLVSDKEIAAIEEQVKHLVKPFSDLIVRDGSKVLFPVDSFTGEGFRALRKVVRHTANDVITKVTGGVSYTSPMCEVKLPTTAVALELLLRKQKEGVISLETCKHLAMDCNIDPETELLHVLWLLHHFTGSIRHYDEDTTLRQYVVTSPQKLYDIPSTLLTHTFAFKKEGETDYDTKEMVWTRGVFTMGTLRKFWGKDKDLSPELIVTFLIHLNIIVQLDDEESGKFFMPSALVCAPNKYIKDEKVSSDSTLVCFNCDYPPKGVFSSVIAYLPKEREENDPVNLKWKLRLTVGSLCCNKATLRVSVNEEFDLLIRFTVHLKFIEIAVNSECEEDPASPAQLQVGCEAVLHDVSRAVKVVSQSLYYDSNATLKNGLFFPCYCRDDPNTHAVKYLPKRKKGRCDHDHLLQPDQLWMHKWIKGTSSVVEQSQHSTPAPPPQAERPTTELPPPVVPTSGTAAPILPSADPLNKPLKIRDLLRRVASRATDKWKRVGLELELEQHQLNTISRSCQDAFECYSEVFSIWQRNADPPFTWATIIDALRSPIVEENALAQEIEDWLRTAAT